MTEKKQKVYVGMSGGVDSSVAAALLKQDGYEVIGVHLVCWDEDEPGCTAADDRAAAERAAAALDIPFQVWDLRAEYKSQVFDYMLKSYQMGITPNPDVICNSQIKFGVFLERALKEGADCVATGHYARREQRAGDFILKEGRDDNKDQSYFLWKLTQAQLSKALFPVGDLEKREVRELARKFGLPNAERPDSQGLCFVGKVHFQEWLEKYLEQQPGEVRNEAGKVLGRHKGINFYTIGQRRGLGLPGGEGPYFVTAKDLKNNVLVVAKTEERRGTEKVKLANLSFINQEAEERAWGEEVKVRMRYRQKVISGQLKPDEEGGAEIVFANSAEKPAAGQSAVFYTVEGEVLGGGVVIESGGVFPHVDR